MEILRRIELRRKVNECWEYVLSEANSVEEEEHIVYLLRKKLDKKRIQDNEGEMNDEQAKAFGKQKMPFGARKGELIEEIPVEYFFSLTDPSPFYKKLKKYANWLSEKERESYES